MKPSDIKPMLKIAYEYRSEIVPCFVGAPGIGKTQGIQEFADETGVKLVTLIVSQMLPSEVSGITMPDASDHSMDVYDHARLSSLEDGDILFFDELFEGEPQVLSACLTLIQSRVMMSGKHLPDIMIVAATNPTYKPSFIKPSVRDRFKFLRVDFDDEAYLRYMRDRFGVNAEPILGRIQRDSDQYNIVTPRSITKLVGWMLAVHEDERLYVKRLIAEMYDESLAGSIFDMVDNIGAKTDKEQIMDVVCSCIKATDGSTSVQDTLIEHDLGEWESMSLSEIAEKLKAMDIWPEIEKGLADVSA